MLNLGRHEIVPMRYYIFFGALFTFVLPASAQLVRKTADSLSIQLLSEVRISALSFNDSLLNAPAAIGILSKADLQRNNLSDISTQLNTVPGVLMQSSNIATNRISIRGIGARTPYGTNKIRAFYGNIPLTSGDSETTIEDIDIENIRQVEIIKGPLSTLYGAGLGGAIVLTPYSDNKLGSTARTSSVYGSFGLVKNSLNYNLETKSSSINIGYHNLQTDGWRDNSAYNREGVTLSGELFRKAKSKLAYFGNYTWLKAFIPSSVDQKTFDNNPKAAAKTWNDAKGYKQYESVLGGLAYDWMLTGKWANSTSIFVNYRDNYEPRPFDILGQYTFAYGARTQFSGDFSIGKTSLKTHFGIEYFRDEYAGSTAENLYQSSNGNGSREGNRLTAFGQQRGFYNAFAQLRWTLSKQWEFQTGISLNQTRFELENRWPETNTERYKYDPIWSPQASILYKPDRFKTVYFSVSRGFSLPAIAETLTPAGTINTDIQPERGTNYELGAKCYFFDKTLHAEVALYRMNISDLLIAERIGDDQYTGINAGKTRHQGVEILTQYIWNISRNVTVAPYVSGNLGAYEFVDFSYAGKDYSGNALTGVAAHQANAGFTFSTVLGWYLSGDFLFTDRIPLNDANSVYNAAYRIFNAKTGWRFEIFPKLNAHIAAGINNIFNAHYASLILPNASGFGGTQPRFYYPGLPVNYYANVQIAYSF